MLRILPSNKKAILIIITILALFLAGQFSGVDLVAARRTKKRALKKRPRKYVRPRRTKNKKKGKKDSVKDKKKKEDAKDETSEKEISYYTELVFLPSYSIPMADLRGALKGGMGGRINLSLDTFSLLGVSHSIKGINSRLGFNGGMHAFKQDTDEYSTKLYLFPMIPFFELNYEFQFGMRIYTRAGYGFTFVTTQKQYKVSIIDNQKVDTDNRSSYALDQTIEYSVGTFFKLFSQVAFYLDASYMMVAESTRAHFLHFSLGLAYHFYQ